MFRIHRELCLDPKGYEERVVRIRDFMRMNPPTFHGSKVTQDSQGFIDEIFKKVDAMGLTPRERRELVTYQLKDVSQV